MKIIALIVSILISILFSNIVMAGDKNEVKLSYGYSGVEWFHINFDLSGNYQCKDKSYGTTSLSYNRRIKEKISIGAGVNYSPLQTNICDYVDGKHVKRSYSEEGVFLYAKFDYRYIVKPEFELYSSISIILPKFIPLHLTVMGIRTGGKHAFFGELGIGLGQIISGGYSIKF